MTATIDPEAIVSKRSLFENLAFSTIRIECDLKEGETSTGTGFFFRFADTGSKHVPAIVTNKHVVAGSTVGRLYFTLRDAAGEPEIGKPPFGWNVVNFEKAWIPHPDPEVDLCMMPIASLLNEALKQGHTFAYCDLTWDLLPSDTDINDFIGMEKIVMVGYPNGIWDRKNNFPVFRSGVAATHYRYEWNGRPEFLIDCACFPGSSGSPVLVCDIGIVPTRKGILTGTSRTKLLGILYAAPQHRVDGTVQIVPIPTAAKAISVSQIPNNLGIVIKANKLRELDDIVRAKIALE